MFLGIDVASDLEPTLVHNANPLQMLDIVQCKNTPPLLTWRHSILPEMLFSELIRGLFDQLCRVLGLKWAKCSVNAVRGKAEQKATLFTHLEHAFKLSMSTVDK